MAACVKRERAHEFRFLVCLTAFLLACPCDSVNSQEMDDDISLIKNNTVFCITDQDPVSNVSARSAQPPSTANVTWNPVSPLPSRASQYQVVYRLLSSTTVQFKNVELDVTATTLTELQDSASYEIYVRLVCSSGVGRLSEGVNLTLVATKPGSVTGIGANVTGNVVTVFWDPLSENEWNGIPLGYYIYIFVRSGSDSFRQIGDVNKVIYPHTSYVTVLSDGQYFFNVLAVNEGSTSVDFPIPSNPVEVPVGDGPFNPGGHPDDVQVLEYPWVYILVPGLVCVCIIIVVSLVICKKVHEKRKRSVSYCRDIEDKTYTTNGGFNNIIPMNNLNSPVTSTSLSIPNSSPTASCSAHQPNPNPLATRPLPNSPMSEVSPTFIEQDVPRFGNGLASNHQPERKMPHPGGLPLLHEAAEPGFVQMHRTNTSQSVFSSSGASAPPNAGHMQRTMRNRAQTVGGIPSPYEVPEQNGNTLPRGAGSDHRPSTAHPNVHQHGHGGGIFQMGMGGGIPPPPAHSPPPLTHSSMEIRARMSDDVFSPPGQHTLPRSMGSSRSYSVTSPNSNSSMGGGGVIRHMKSDGHLPILETHEEKMVYIQAPLDSSIEASIHSASSYGAGAGAGGGVVVGGANERRPSPHRHHHNYHHTHHNHMGGGQQQMRQASNSATYVAGSESFSEMTSEPGSIQSGVPRMPPMHHPPSFNRERSNVSGGGGRESVFSETSTELSISSGSGKELSPSWDHRGTTSEVGVGFHLPTDDPPMDREAYSDVGTPGQIPGHSHRVYKQALPPIFPVHVSYMSPASINSSTLGQKPHP